MRNTVFLALGAWAALSLTAAFGAPAANLLGNHDFASGMFEPEGWALNNAQGNQVIWVCDKADPARCALRIIGSGHDWAGVSGAGIPGTTLAAKPGEVITVAAWLKARDVVAGQGHLYVRQFGATGFKGQDGPLVPENAADWALVSGTVTARDGTEQADFSLQLWSTGEVLLGKVGLFRGDMVADLAQEFPAPGPMDPVEVKVPRNVAVDANHNGIPDVLETFLNVPQGAKSIRQTRRNTTCFQTPTGYREDNDLKVDSILVVNPSRSAIGSWQQMGYHSWYMTGFRAGPEYVAAHPGSVQQDRAGNLLDCGPGSYYMVPTADRRAILREQCRTACANGAEAVAPEEPEFIGRGGYSPAFKAEFQAFYGRPWVAPDSSPQARIDCQRLMGHLEVELLRACYDGAHAGNPKAQTFLLCHSPLNYSAWNIMFPHCETIRALKPDHMIAQVWTGTARSAVTYQGIARERTFENGWLEYSSSLNLVRGLNIPVWLLMDPVEDNPNLPMEDYFVNYKRTLAASLMFPESDRFEVMPWPTRIFGRVPPPFATTVCTIVSALADIQSYPQAKQDCGTGGIATFLADSAMWQRQGPSQSDFNAVYGLCLPLFMRGIPAQIAQLDRVGDPGYLDPYKVLLVSFEAMKPQSKANVDGLVAWVKGGGRLIVFGDADAYNDVDLWWKQEGCASPHEYLLKALGLNPAGMVAVSPTGVAAEYKVVAETDYTGRNLENRAKVRIDLTPFARTTGSVYLRFEDTIKTDGWGPWIGSVRLIGTRDGKPLDATAKAGTPEEAALIASDSGSGFNGEGRFVDGTKELVYQLAFDPGTKAEVELDLGNQYRVSAASAPAQRKQSVRAVAGSALGKALVAAGMPQAQGWLAYPKLGGSPALTTDDGATIAEATVGKGRVILCGVPPATFTRSEAGDRMMRALVRYACETRGDMPYREQGHIGIERGPYVVVKTFDEPAPIREPMIDLMTADLAIRPAGVLKPDDLAVLKKLPQRKGEAPQIAATSGCLEWSITEGKELRAIVSGPKGTPGVMRLVTGGRRLTVEAQDGLGQKQSVTVEAQGATTLLRFDLLPQGVGMRVRAE